jgi:hypothetical protein
MTLWSEQECVSGSIMKNSKVYCLISVYSFVIIFKVYILKSHNVCRDGGGGYNIAGGCFTNMCYIVLKPSTRSMPPMYVVAAWGAVYSLPRSYRSDRYNDL